MNLSETTINILFGVAIFLLLVISIYIRIRRTKNSPMWRVVSILRSLNKNEKMVENLGIRHNMTRLKTDAWKKYKDRIEFLPEELRRTLSQVFEMSEEVNGRIDSARKFKSDSYLAGVDVSKLKAPLAKSRQQLRDWVQENIQNPEYLPKRRRGLFR